LIQYQSSFKIKAMKLHIIESGNFKLDGGAMFGIIPKPLWQKRSEPDEQNRIDLSLRLMLLKTQSKNILIDTGIGDYHGQKWDNRFDVRGQKNPLKNQGKFWIVKRIERLKKKPYRTFGNCLKEEKGIIKRSKIIWKTYVEQVKFDKQILYIKR